MVLWYFVVVVVLYAVVMVDVVGGSWLGVIDAVVKVGVVVIGHVVTAAIEVKGGGDRARHTATINGGGERELERDDISRGYKSRP